MTQKTIWSFFSKSPKNRDFSVQSESEINDENGIEKSEENSPTKLPTKIKRRRISSSDEEEKLSTKSPETDSKKKRTLTNSPDSDSEDPKENGSKTSPIKNESKASPIENGSKKTPIKMETKTSPTAKVSSSASDKKSAKKKVPEKSKKTPTSSKKSTTKSKKTKSKAAASDTSETEVKEEEPTLSPDTKAVKTENDEQSPDDKEVKKEDNKSTSKPNMMSAFFTRKSDDKAKGNNSQAGIDYNPGKKNYHPINDAFWKHGEKVPYLALTQTFAMVEDISGRLRTIEVLANFLRSVIVLSPDDLLACVYLCMNQLAPTYEGLELGVAETSLMKVIAQTTGRSMNQIKADSKDTGDLGIVAERSKSNQRMMFTPAPLTVNGVFLKLKEIARMSGHAAMGKKVDKIQSIFVSCRHSEARFFIRSLLGKLRIGLAEQSLLQAIAQACTLTPPNQKEYPPPILQAVKGETALKQRVEDTALIVKTTYCQCPNYDKMIAVLLSDGIDALLEKCKMTPGTPLKPMLAHPSKGVQEVLQRFDGLKFTCEYKYDGERAQIHIHSDGTVNIFSRNQENNTTKYPDIISRIDMATKNDSVQSCILDCEAVAWDTEKKQILPFQQLSTRKRKDVNEDDIKVQVCVFMFDLLYLNGEPLVTLPFAKRRELLREHFCETNGLWNFAVSLDTGDIDELQEFLEISVKGNCEGLMVKTLEHDATYEIAKRSRNWLKLKKDYLSGVGDSLDLVVIGGFKGKGKRTGTFGGFLLACYDNEDERYQSICKIGTGFSDEDLANHTEFFKPHVIPNPKSYFMYDSSHEPDDWFEPIQIWEVLCADLSLSPVHKAAIGIVDPEKGISLRFPRFIRIRDDKSVDDATSAQQVADMYSNQDQIKNQDKSSNAIKEEDFY